jgi:hypothetical protein
MLSAANAKPGVSRLCQQVSNKTQSRHTGERPPNGCHIGLKSGNHELHDLADGKNVQAPDFAPAIRHIDDRNRQFPRSRAKDGLDEDVGSIWPADPPWHSAAHIRSPLEALLTKDNE